MCVYMNLVNSIVIQVSFEKSLKHRKKSDMVDKHSFFLFKLFQNTVSVKIMSAFD